MRQTHAGGDKLFVDYAGDTVPIIIDRLTGKTRPAQIFVAVLGASNFTYAANDGALATGGYSLTSAVVTSLQTLVTALQTPAAGCTNRAAASRAAASRRPAAIGIKRQILWHRGEGHSYGRRRERGLLWEGRV